MTLHALVTGTLWEAPGQHTSKNGNSFVAATIKLRDGDATQWVRLLAFGTDAQAELTRLDSGDSLSVQGNLKADVYAPEGREPRVNLTIFVDAVLSPKPKKAKPERPKPERAASSVEPVFDDGFPEAWGGPR